MVLSSSSSSRGTYIKLYSKLEATHEKNYDLHDFGAEYDSCYLGGGCS